MPCSTASVTCRCRPTSGARTVRPTARPTRQFTRPCAGRGRADRRPALHPRAIARLRGRGVRVLPITLHVGYGTLAPVRVADIRAHRMHAQRFVIPAAHGRGHRRCARGRRPGRGGRHDGRRTRNMPRTLRGASRRGRKPLARSSTPAIASRSWTPWSPTSTCPGRPCSCSWPPLPAVSRRSRPTVRRSAPGTGSSVTGTRCH